MTKYKCSVLYTEVQDLYELALVKDYNLEYGGHAMGWHAWVKVSGDLVCSYLYRKINGKFKRISELKIYNEEKRLINNQYALLEMNVLSAFECKSDEQAINKFELWLKAYITNN